MVHAGSSRAGGHPCDEPGRWRRDTARWRSRDQRARTSFGQTGAELSILSELLDDEVDVYGHDDHRPLELRRQIGLLELAAGQRENAEHTLADLRDDLVRLHGPEHPTVSQLNDLLDGSLTQ